MTIKGTVEDEQTQFWWVNSPGCRRKNMSRGVMTPTVPDIVSVFMCHSIRRAKNVLEEELDKASFAPD